MEKTLEFDNIIEMGQNEIFDFPTDENIDTISTHFDKDKDKYIVTVEYGKKT